MKTIKILGSCCSNCDSLENNLKLALEKSWIEANVIKVTNIEEITSYSIMSIPAIVIDEKVVSSGRS